MYTTRASRECFWVTSLHASVTFIDPLIPRLLEMPPVYVVQEATHNLNKSSRFAARRSLASENRLGLAHSRPHLLLVTRPYTSPLATRPYQAAGRRCESTHRDSYTPSASPQNSSLTLTERLPREFPQNIARALSKRTNGRST